MNTENIKQLYFLGIGGIGMSALARYYQAVGYEVLGYDRMPSPLTHALEKEGIQVVYADDEASLAAIQKQIDKAYTLVVRTPAVPESEPIHAWMREQGFSILKRSELLGLVTRQKKALCVAGTHGKTTTSTILAHIMHESEQGTNAFLGGISNNYNSNLLIDEQSDFVVVEADEYDRSFHHLAPYMTVITSIDPDHLDIYGTAEEYQNGFDTYAGLVKQAIILKKGFTLSPTIANNRQSSPKIYTYSAVEKADFYADTIRVEGGEIFFDFVGPDIRIANVRLGVPVWVNIENSVAAMAVAWLNGVGEKAIRLGVESYKGVYRRFNIHVNTDKVVYVDDYAHHPTEINASIQSIRKVYSDRHFIVVFQPHLYTRTRDFAANFRHVLHQADELILLPIYPARELPIPGVTSDILGECVVEKKDIVEYVARRIKAMKGPVAVLSLGAGDIDRLVPEFTQTLSNI